MTLGEILRPGHQYVIVGERGYLAKAWCKAGVTFSDPQSWTRRLSEAHVWPYETVAGWGTGQSYTGTGDKQYMVDVTQAAELLPVDAVENPKSPQSGEGEKP
jgi:hypothetical protein